MHAREGAVGNVIATHDVDEQWSQSLCLGSCLQGSLPLRRASRHYDEQALGTLIIAIVTINAWNRMSVATRQLAGQKW